MTNVQKHGAVEYNFGPLSKQETRDFQAYYGLDPNTYPAYGEEVIKREVV